MTIKRLRLNNRRKGRSARRELCAEAEIQAIAQSLSHQLACRKNKTEGFCIRFIAIPDLLIEYPIADMVLSFSPHSVDEINTALDALASAWDWRRHVVPNRF